MHRSPWTELVALLVLVVSGGACSGADDPAGTAASPQRATPPTPLAITASDYAFEAPDSIEGGLVEVEFSNVGVEPHFVGFARVGAGASFGDVKAALTAPPGSPAPSNGPPPFEPFAGVPAAAPGVSGNMVLNLPSGTYALFCSIPAPDGAPHAVKGMVRELVVSDGPAGALPRAVQTVTATDFSLTDSGELDAGAQVVKLRNDGRQLHEINLLELRQGARIEDAVAWIAEPVGPPPYRSLAGVAVMAGEEATTELILVPEKDYAFVCVIPDALGDRAPHAAKGMFTPIFRVADP